MMSKLKKNGELLMCLCYGSLGLMLLYLCVFKVFAQVPPPSNGSGGGSGSEPTVQFSAYSYTVAEGDMIDIPIVLSGPYSQTVSVGYATSDGTGYAGVDYQAISGTLPFPPGNTQEFFTVTTYNDPNNTSYVTVNLTLSSPSNAMLGSPSTATLYIVNPNSCQ
jgi:hypothetical protein